MRKSTVAGSVKLTLVVIFLLSIAIPPIYGKAEAKTVAIEGTGYNVNLSLSDNLQSLLGKRVSITLRSGKNFTGIVKVVGNHLVHMEKIEGKEFFDALIRIENISAIDTRFREIAR